MFDHPAPSITTTDGETGAEFVPAPAGLTAVIATVSGTSVRKTLGPVVGYARFNGASEPVYSTAVGLHRLSTAPLTGWWSRDGYPVTTAILTAHS